MKRRTLYQAILVMVILLLLAAGFSQAQKPETADSGPLAAESAIGTSFTYQGQLVYNGAPVNDSCDFTFSLWDAAGSGSPPVGGIQIGSDVPRNGITVSNGLFTVSLDFGDGPFNGDARWLEIAVDCGSISGTLSPRQPLSPIPYALYAANADKLDGQHASAFATEGHDHDTDYWSLTGNAGTTASAHFLGTTGAQPLVLRTDNSERMRLDAAGNLGIGTDNPNERLTVRGNARVLGEDDPVALDYTDIGLGDPRSMYVSGHYAYVGSQWGSQLAIFDVSDPENIVPKDSTGDNLSHPSSVFVSGRYAYVASSSNDRLVIFDVSSPDQIVAKGFISTNLDYPISVFVSGRYVYVVGLGNESLSIFDVSDPENIIAKDYTSSNLEDPWSVFVSGHYAYVISGENDRLVIFDVSDPENIVPKGYTDTNLRNPRSVFVSGRYAYVASGSNHTLAIFDVSDPDNIVAKDTTTTNLGFPNSVFVAGDYAYVANNHGRIAVFDVSDSDNIVAKGVTSTNIANANSVFVSGRYAYVVSEDDNDNLLSIFELNNLEAPTGEIGSLETGSLQVMDNATIGNGLQVQGGLNVGPGGALVNGDLGVEGSIRAVGDAADSVLYLSPHELVVRGDSTGLTLRPLDSGGMRITNTSVGSGITRYFSVPMSTFGTLFGSPVYVKAVEVCYQADTISLIDVTAVIKNNGGTGSTNYLLDNDNQTSTTHDCYTVDAVAPYKMIDNSSWVQFNIYFTDNGDEMTLYTVAVTLTESDS